MPKEREQQSAAKKWEEMEALELETQDKATQMLDRELELYLKDCVCLLYH